MQEDLNILTGSRPLHIDIKSPILSENPGAKALGSTAMKH